MSKIIHLDLFGSSNIYQAIPVYSLRASGGPFLANREIRELGWAMPPTNLTAVEPNHFYVQVEGTSMEPRIHSGDFCLVRRSVAGYMSGSIVIVEERKIAECGYALKRFYIEPLTGRIFLKSFNPDQPDIEIDERGESQDQSYAIVAEFLQVVKIELIKPLYQPDEHSQALPQRRLIH